MPPHLYSHPPGECGKAENVFIYIFSLKFQFTFVFPFLSPGPFDTIVNTIKRAPSGIERFVSPSYSFLFNNILCGHKKKKKKRTGKREYISREYILYYIKNAEEISTLQVFKPVPFCVVCTGITRKNGLTVGFGYCVPLSRNYDKLLSPTIVFGIAPPTHVKNVEGDGRDRIYIIIYTGVHIL